MSAAGLQAHRLAKVLAAPPVAAVAVAVAYAAVALAGHTLATLPGHISAIFPSAGIALAAVLIMGRRALAGVFLGSLAANATPYLLVQAPLAPPTTEFLVELLVATGAAAGAGVGAYLVRRSCGDQPPLHSARNVLALLAVGALGGCLISSTVGVLSLSVAGIMPWKSFPSAWLTWWVGDAAGVIVAAPLVLAW